VNLMSMTAKAIDMAVPISIASHLRFFIFFPNGFFAIDVVSFLFIYSASILYYYTRSAVILFQIFVWF
jgi:hypothetical protein